MILLTCFKASINLLSNIFFVAYSRLQALCIHLNRVHSRHTHQTAIRGCSSPFIPRCHPQIIFVFLFSKGFLKTSLKFSTSICKELKYIVYSDCCLQGGVQYHCVHCALSTCFECTNLSILECIVHSSSSAALCRPVPWPR